jgi:hypothetical protein
MSFTDDVITHDNSANPPQQLTSNETDLAANLRRHQIAQNIISFRNVSNMLPQSSCSASEKSHRQSCNWLPQNCSSYSAYNYCSVAEQPQVHVGYSTLSTTQCNNHQRQKNISGFDRLMTSQYPMPWRDVTEYSTDVNNRLPLQQQ